MLFQFINESFVIVEVEKRSFERIAQTLKKMTGDLYKKLRYA